jgi:hypothetical protein
MTFQLQIDLWMINQKGHTRLRAQSFFRNYHSVCLYECNREPQRKEVLMSYFKVLTQHSSGGNEENHERSQWKDRTTNHRPIFDPEFPEQNSGLHHKIWYHTKIKMYYAVHYIAIAHSSCKSSLWTNNKQLLIYKHKTGNAAWRALWCLFLSAYLIVSTHRTISLKHVQLLSQKHCRKNNGMHKYSYSQSLIRCLTWTLFIKYKMSSLLSKSVITSVTLVTVPLNLVFSVFKSSNEVVQTISFI